LAGKRHIALLRLRTQERHQGMSAKYSSLPTEAQMKRRFIQSANSGPESHPRVISTQHVKEIAGMLCRHGNTALHGTLFSRALMAFLFIAGLIFSGVPGYGQLNETGTITGSVTDQTGAVVPGAAVVVTNVSTGASTPLKSNASGEFTQVGLNVGNYSVKVSMEGFGTYEQNNFYLAPTSTYTVKVVLKPGETVTAVDVAADAVVPELTTSEISTEIPGKESSMLALNGRNYQELATLMPGVVNLSAGTSIATGGYVANNSVSVNGMGKAASSTPLTVSGMKKQATSSPTPSSLRRRRLTRRR